ncbi:hypothetical protein BDW75DRAFT_154769 [Aspergillus navahoensis]
MSPGLGCDRSSAFLLMLSQQSIIPALVHGHCSGPSVSLASFAPLPKEIMAYFPGSDDLLIPPFMTLPFSPAVYSILYFLLFSCKRPTSDWLTTLTETVLSQV